MLSGKFIATLSLTMGMSAAFGACPHLDGTYACEATEHIEATKMTITSGSLELNENGEGAAVYHILETGADTIISDMSVITDGTQRELLSQGESMGFYTATCKDNSLVVSLSGAPEAPAQIEIAMSREDRQLSFIVSANGEVWDSSLCTQE